MARTLIGLAVVALSGMLLAPAAQAQGFGYQGGFIMVNGGQRVRPEHEKGTSSG